MPRRPTSKHLRTGRQLKAARVAADLTQQQLADAAGLHVSTLKYCERQQILTVSRWYTIDPIVEALERAGVGVAADPRPMIWLIHCPWGRLSTGHSAQVRGRVMGFNSPEGIQENGQAAEPNRQNDPSDRHDGQAPVNDDHDSECEALEELGLDINGYSLPKHERPLCKARTRSGRPCRGRVVPGKRRCRMHGGMSTGPKSQEGRERIAQAQILRWKKWRAQHRSD